MGRAQTEWRWLAETVYAGLVRRRQRAAERRALALLFARRDARLLADAGLSAVILSGASERAGLGGETADIAADRTCWLY